MILLDFHNVHNDKAYWDHPEEFRPQRFLDDTGRFCPNSASMIFGLGKLFVRSCFKCIQIKFLRFRQKTLSRRNAGSVNLVLILHLRCTLLRYRNFTRPWKARSERLRWFHLIAETVPPETYFKMI